MLRKLLLLVLALAPSFSMSGQLLTAGGGTSTHLVASPTSLTVADATASTATLSISATRSSTLGNMIVSANLSDASVGTVTVTNGTIAGSSGVATISLAVSKDVAPGDYSLSVAATDSTGTVQLSVPIRVGSDAFSIVFGLGSLITDSAGQDYKVQNDTLIATSVGRSRPELNLGAAFRVKFPTPTPAGIKYPWNAFVSVRLVPGADKAVGGYVVGASYRVSKYLDGLIGFSLSPTDEPTAGFRKAAIQVVQNNPNLDVYKRFIPADMVNNRPGAFDGFPLAVQSATGPTGQRVFPTDPFVTHYRGGLFVGVAFPFSFKAKLIQ